MSLLPTRLISRRLAAVSALVALALPVAGCGESGTGDTEADPAGAIPASAIVYAEALVRPDGPLAADLKTVGAKVLRTPDPARRLRELLDKGLKDEGASYAKNIEPWLGDRVGLAVTSLRDSAKPEIVVSAAVSDTEAATAEVKRDRKGDKTTDRSYRDVDYRVNATQQSVAGIVGDLLVATETEAAFKKAVDATRGQSLAKAKRYVEARDAVQDERLGLLYAEPSRIFDAVAASAGPIGAQLGPLRSALTAGGARSVAAALTVDGDAIRVQTATIGAKRGSGPAAAAGAPDTLAALPQGSWLAAGVGDVGRQVDELIKQAGGPLGGAFLGQIENQIGLNIRKDLLAWMGEGGLFVMGEDLQNPDAAFVVESKDPAASEAAVGKLAELARKQGMPVQTAQVDGAAEAVAFAAQTNPEPVEVIVAAGSDRFVIAIGRRAAEQALRPAKALSSDARFRAAAARLGGGVRPSFFVDFPTVVRIIGVNAGDDAELTKAKPYLDAYSQIVSGAKADGDIARQELVVGVK